MLRPGRKAFLLLVALTAINASYLRAFDSATIFYHANVIAHVVLGVVLTAALLWGAVRVAVSRRRARGAADGRLIYPLAALAMTATGLYLAKVGTYTPYIPLLRVHETAALVFLVVFCLGIAIRGTRGRAGILIALAALVIFPAAVRLEGVIRPAHVATITNPLLPPLTPFEEGSGEKSPFFPSSIR